MCGTLTFPFSFIFNIEQIADRKSFKLFQP